MVRALGLRMVGWLISCISCICKVTLSSAVSGYFFSSNLSQCHRVMEALQTGMIGVNGGQVSAAETPFGGYKQSGLGRESGYQGMDEYMQVKSCVMSI